MQGSLFNIKGIIMPDLKLILRNLQEKYLKLIKELEIPSIIQINPPENSLDITFTFRNFSDLEVLRDIINEISIFHKSSLEPNKRYYEFSKESDKEIQSCCIIVDEKLFEFVDLDDFFNKLRYKFQEKLILDNKINEIRKKLKENTKCEVSFNNSVVTFYFVDISFLNSLKDAVSEILKINISDLQNENTVLQIPHINITNYAEPEFKININAKLFQNVNLSSFMDLFNMKLRRHIISNSKKLFAAKAPLNFAEQKYLEEISISKLCLFNTLVIKKVSKKNAFFNVFDNKKEAVEKIKEFEKIDKEIERSEKDKWLVAWLLDVTQQSSVDTSSHHSDINTKKKMQ